jgi:nucleoside-diphosphate-sugar epimerase
MKEQTISILGCGWYGFALAKQLIIDGHTVKGSTTTPNKLTALEQAGIRPYLIDIASPNHPIDLSFFNCDVLIIAISPKTKTENSVDYVQQIKRIVQLAIQGDSKQLILISSTGIFEDNNSIVDEDSVPNPNTASGIALQEAENILQTTTQLSNTIIRFGGLIGPNRNLAKYFAGKEQLSNGLAPINLIHLTDCIGLTKSIIDQEQFGHLYHGVSPSHLTREAFYTAACLASHLAKPSFIAEKNNWKQIESKNVPTILNYAYVYTTWDSYFKELLALSAS